MSRRNWTRDRNHVFYCVVPAKPAARLEALVTSRGVKNIDVDNLRYNDDRTKAIVVFYVEKGRPSSINSANCPTCICIRGNRATQVWLEAQPDWGLPQ